MNNYTASDKLEFQRNQKWIAFESIFKTLCEYYHNENCGPDTQMQISEIKDRAKVVVEWMQLEWPMQEITDEPFPTTNRAPVKGAVPEHCPQCGADVKHKTGKNKTTGKPYDFYGCAAYPECRWVFKQ